MASCVRTAWLQLGTLTQPLEDESAGYICPSLDLGSPEVREVVRNRPDHHGTDDRTRYYGARPVTVEIVAVSPDARIDEIATAFAPFMLPDARPELHYVLDRADNPERVMTLRGSDYSWPIAGAETREIHLGFVASDPFAYDATLQWSTSWAGSTGQLGRIYDLTFPRVYPTDATPPVTGQTETDGDIAVRPVILIYGPIVGAEVAFQDPGGIVQRFALKDSTTIDAGAWIEVDADARTVRWNGDPARSAMAEVDWARPSVWPIFQPHVLYSFTLTADGGGTSSSTQARAQWRDGFLS